MSSEISTPKKIWIITEEIPQTSTTNGGSRSSDDTGGLLVPPTTEKTIEQKPQSATTQRKQVEVNKLKDEMKGFLQAMREILDEAETPNSKIQLNEVELSVEINGEGQISLFGFGGTKAGGKGAMTFKFKRK